MHTPRNTPRSPRAPHPGAPMMRASDFWTVIIFLIVAFGGIGAACVYRVLTG